MSEVPAGYEVRSRKEWEELLASNDPVKRGQVNQALRAWGAKASDYLKLGDAEKVDYLMKRQQEAGAGEEKAAKPGKSKVAEPADSTPAKTTAAGPADKGGGVSAKQLADIQAQLVELGKELIAVKKMVLDVLYLARVETIANSELSANADDPGVREELYGKLLEDPEGNG